MIASATTHDDEGRGFPTVAVGAVAVLVPARNEAAQIVDTIRSLKAQTYAFSDIVVIANNCTDDTADRARDHGVKVLDLPCNPHKKAGALNAGLAELLRGDEFPEFIVTMDADTVLDENFVARAVAAMRRDTGKRIGVISAVCRGKVFARGDWRMSILTWFQRAEYHRASRTRLRHRIHSMSGAGAMMRAEAVADVLSRRPHLFEERASNLVEDYELTLELHRLGWVVTNNYYCIAFTDLMTTRRDLVAQRVRWTRGSLDELRSRGWRHETWLSIAYLGAGLLCIPLFYLWVWNLLLLVGSGHVAPATFAFPLGCALYQMLTLRGMGWRSQLVALLLLPEVCYAVLRHYWVIKSLYLSYFSRSYVWS